MLKHYVEYYLPGSFFPEYDGKEIPSRDESSILEAIADKPKNCYALSFYSIEKSKSPEGRELTSSSFDKSKRILFGKVYTLDQMREKYGKDESYKILIINMECNNWNKVVKCNTGNWQPVQEGETVIEN